MTTQEYLSENELRKAKLFPYYSPVTGEGSPIPRFPVRIGEHTTLYVPNVAKEKMPWLFKPELCENLPKYCHKHNYDVSDILLMIEEVRYKCDFEFWAYKHDTIRDKKSGKDIPFQLNAPQRLIHKEVHEELFNNIPVRFDIGKSRKWGGSTYVNALFNWIQSEIKIGWNSIIVTDVEDQARGIRSMITKFASNYHRNDGFTLAPFEGSTKNKYIPQRDCTISIGSMQKPDSLRSGTSHLAHLSEIGIWKETLGKKPEDLIQTVSEMVMEGEPWTCIFRESTAKGVGNYWHTQWLKDKKGETNYKPIFIPWYIEETNTLPVKDHEDFINSWNDYEKFLWGEGATIEGINWYRRKLKNYSGNHWRMMSENPTTDIEMFQSTGSRTFRQEDVKRSRLWNQEPIFKGDIVSRTGETKGAKALTELELVPNEQGALWLWRLPNPEVKIAHQFVTPMDIGGRWEGADYSVIRVIDRKERMNGGCDEGIGTYIGHIDHDLLAWKGAQISTIFNNSLYVPESNTLDSDGTEGDHSITILNEVAEIYTNLYCRTSPEMIKAGFPKKWGFHTNSKTKPALVSNMIGAVRDDTYLECDSRCCDEMDTMETKQNGTYGAVDGSNDDIFMATGIGEYVSNEMPIPYIIEENKTTRTRVIAKTEAVL